MNEDERLNRFNLGFTGCYITDYYKLHVKLCNIPGKAALEWVREILPDSNLGFRTAKDTDTPDSWLNKLFIIIEEGYNYSLALYKHDWHFYLYRVEYEK